MKTAASGNGLDADGSNGNGSARERGPAGRHAVVIGGAGFIGTNMADHLAAAGRRVVVFDNFSRAGVEANAAWLTRKHGERIVVRRGDVRDSDAVRDVLAHASVVYHFAAQVAVTTSLLDPRTDCEVNTLGTLNVLEALRRQERPAALLFTSTNKVYGDLPKLELVEEGDRYQPAPGSPYAQGVRETELDFHSPYGCSKGAADQYVLDYARTFGLPTVVFRMSCIYGPHQCGNADQGWVAHFAGAALNQQPITIYGDGRQVRDVLYVGDLVDAMVRATASIDITRGQAFNVGGGREHTLSLRELCALLEQVVGHPIDLTYEDWRPSDQRYYVSDTTKLTQAIGWRPDTDVRAGVEHLLGWLAEAGQTKRSAAEPLRPTVVVPRRGDSLEKRLAGAGHAAAPRNGKG